MMGYPFVLAYDKAQFARLNYNGSWSVRWDKTIAVSNQALTIHNRAIVACAKVLMAAKDRLALTSWEQSDAWDAEWDHHTNIIDQRESDSPLYESQFTMALHGNQLACVNYDGSWSIEWDRLDECSGTFEDDWHSLAVLSFARLLMLARPILCAETQDKLGHDIDVAMLHEPGPTIPSLMLRWWDSLLIWCHIR